MPRARSSTGLEHRTFNPDSVGSSPIEPTNIRY